MSATRDRVHLPLRALSNCGCTPLARAVAALGLGLGLTTMSAVAQDTGNSSQPLLAPAPAERSPSEVVNSGATNAGKHELDLNDPRVIAAISEAMDNPISELLAVWNQFDAIQAHFPRTPFYD